MMLDLFSPHKRSQIMSSIRSYDTKPELFVRSILHRMGFRFRLRQGRLPGNPDIVLPLHKKVIFIHGCFWHGHKNCKRSKRPDANIEFWSKKLDGNMARDKRQIRALRRMGWRVLVLWQCQLRNKARLEKRLVLFMTNSRGGD